MASGASFLGDGIQQNGSGSINAQNINIGNSSASSLLGYLHITDPRHDKIRIEMAKGGLLHDSYTWILEHEKFKLWRDNGCHSLLWVKGDPGKGKTMLLCGIIHELEKSATIEHITVSYFFCQATDLRLNSATAVMRGIIFHLVSLHESLIRHLKTRCGDGGQRVFEDVNSAVLLSEVLRDMLSDPVLGNTCLIIDALDECTYQLDFLLSLIIDLSSIPTVKVLASSRKFPEIQAAFAHVKLQLDLETEDNAHMVAKGVYHYIDHCVASLAAAKSLTESEQREVTDAMRQKADSTFLWVALAVSELRKAHVASYDLTDILNEIPGGLPSLYQRMIDQIQSLDGAKIRERCRRALSAVVLAYRPLKYPELFAFTNPPSNVHDERAYVDDIANKCGSFFSLRDGYDTVYLVHQSARDFLLGEDGFLFPNGHAPEHINIALNGLKRMAQTLRRNIYSLPSPGTLAEGIQNIGEDPLWKIGYDCLYWSEHIVDSIATNQTQTSSLLLEGGVVHEFMKAHLLHWLEALSLQQTIPESIYSLTRLEGIMKPMPDSALRLLLQDVVRFVRYFRPAIESAPLQLYSSALVFCPKKSIVRTLFNKELRGVSCIFADPEMEEWPLHLQTLNGHQGEVVWVSFSHDCKFIMSATTVDLRIWDVVTGQCISTLRSNDNELFLCGAFSISANSLRTLSDDGKVRCWEAGKDMTAIACRKTLSLGINLRYRQSPPVATMSSTATHVMVAFKAGEVMLWNLDTDQHYSIWTKYGPLVTASFSLEGDQFVVATKSGTIHTFCLETSEVQQTVRAPGHISIVRDPYFSTRYDFAWAGWGGLQMSAGHIACYFDTKDDDHVCYLWSSTDREWKLSPLSTEHDIPWGPSLLKLAVLPTGTQVALKVVDKILLVNTDAGYQAVLPHFSGLCCASYSADGKWLVTGSDDSSVRLWDIKGASGPHVERARHLEDLHLDTAAANWVVAEYSDGSFASRSLSETTVHRSKRIDYGGQMRAIAIFPRGDQMAISTDLKTLELWSFETGTRHKSIEVDLWPSELHVSPDGVSVLAICALHSRALLWNTESDALEQIVNQPPATRPVSPSAWSPDGARFALISDEACIEIWNKSTMERSVCLRDDEDFTAMAFSPFNQGHCLVTTSRSGNVKVWDTVAGSCQHTFRIPDHLARTSFSFNGVNLRLICSEYTRGASESFNNVQNSSDLAGYGLSVDLQWITFNGENHLWIPPELKPWKFSTQGPMVAIRTLERQGVVLKFSGDPFKLSRADTPFAGESKALGGQMNQGESCAKRKFSPSLSDGSRRAKRLHLASMQENDSTAPRLD